MGRETKTVTVTKETEVTTTVTCDCCGEAILTEEDCQRVDVHGDPWEEDREQHTIQHHFGYNSGHFGDETFLDGVICEKCLHDWVKTWKNATSVLRTPE